MRLLQCYLVVCLFLINLSGLLQAQVGSSPCNSTNYQLSDFGITRTYTLDSGTFEGLPDPGCGDYQGQSGGNFS